MIQIQRAEQFTKAAERLRTEHMGVRRHEPHLYEVTNKGKGHSYHVRITRQNGRTFGSCTCPAGLRHGRHPLVCKHLAAVSSSSEGFGRCARGSKATAGKGARRKLASGSEQGRKGNEPPT